MLSRGARRLGELSAVRAPRRTRSPERGRAGGRARRRSLIAGDDPPASSDGAVTDDAVDRFYQGRILRLYPGSRSGVVRTGGGRDVAFAVPHVQIVGTTRGFA